MDNREKEWLLKRTGRFTASGMKKLMTKGTKGRAFGDTAIGYLYQIAYERRTGRPVRGTHCANFDFGHENEPRAIEWLRANTNLTVRSCTTDYPDIIFVTHPQKDYIGDSPDFYCLDDNDKIEAIGEIKCFASQAKFEEVLESTKADMVDEYKEQLATHFLCHPEVDKLIYVIYDGSSDDDDFDPCDFNNPDRGAIFIYYRSEFKDLIQLIEKRADAGFQHILIAEQQTEVRIRDINDYYPQ